MITMWRWWLPLLAQTAFGAHAAMDALCVFCTLFPDACCCVVLDASSELYTWIFVEEDDRTHPVLRRFVAYWVATMSLVRVLALLLARHLGCCCFFFIALVYAIEALAFEYEGTVGATMRRSTARAAAAVSLLLGLTAAWLASAPEMAG